MRQSWKEWQLVRQLVYTMLVSNNRPLFHLWSKKNLVKHRKVSKYYETDCRKNRQNQENPKTFQNYKPVPIHPTKMNIFSILAKNF